MNPLNSRNNKVAGFIFKAQLAQEAINQIKGKSTHNSELNFSSVSKKVSLDLLEKELVTEAVLPRFCESEILSQVALAC